MGLFGVEVERAERAAFRIQPVAEHGADAEFEGAGAIVRPPRFGFEVVDHVDAMVAQRIQAGALVGLVLGEVALIGHAGGVGRRGDGAVLADQHQTGPVTALEIVLTEIDDQLQ